MASNTVTGASVASTSPDVVQPTKKPTHSGSSSISFSFYGVLSNSAGFTVVVLNVGTKCDVNTPAVNRAADGAIFKTGATGMYCEITTSTKDLNNWTVMASSDKDKTGTGITFVAGTGGGGY